MLPDGYGSAGGSVPEATEHPPLRLVVERRAGLQVKAQLGARRAAVRMLTSRPAGRNETPHQLALGNGDRFGDGKVHGHQATPAENA